MYADPYYAKAVLADYDRKRKMLSPRLSNPTPGNLKKECLIVLNSRKDGKDTRWLRTFFEVKEGMTLTENLVRHFETDKFRPLSNYLRDHQQGQAGNTYEKNIELLAWLIDFKDRPHDPEKKITEEDPPIVIVPGGTGNVTGNEESNQGVESDVKDPPPPGFIHIPPSPRSDDTPSQQEATPQTTSSEVPPNITDPPQKTKSGFPDLKFLGNALIALVIVAATAGGIYYSNKPPADIKQIVSNDSLPQRCMYWTGDHYEQVSCNRQMGDTLVVAYDSVRFHGFKKINRKDTISRESIGKVGYFKKGGVIEFFTACGNHPLDPRLKLKPLTRFMYDNHIKPQRPPD